MPGFTRENFHLKPSLKSVLTNQQFSSRVSALMQPIKLKIEGVDVFSEGIDSIFDLIFQGKMTSQFNHLTFNFLYLRVSILA